MDQSGGGPDAGGPGEDAVSSDAYRLKFSAPPPEPPADTVEAARLAPESWIGMVDPAWKGSGAPPEWAVVGWWRSGSSGKVEEWQENRAYKASPQALGFPEPTDPVDAAVQLASTGYGPAEDVHRRLAAAEVAVLIEFDGAPVLGTAPNNSPVLPVYTSPKHVEAAGRLQFDVRPVTDLVQQLPLGHQLYINPTGPVSMLVETEALLTELDDTEPESTESADDTERPEKQATPPSPTPDTTPDHQPPTHAQDHPTPPTRSATSS
nr:type VII secretion system-associated protein [Streptomyces zhihengii]